jgi:septum formation protein
MPEARNDTRLILASASPRRKYLLEQAGLRFEVIPGEVDETGMTADSPSEHVRLLAEAKAAEIARRHPQAWVIGADTVVVIDGRILGKPAGMDQARRMLNRLSGQRHQVHTGYAVYNLARSRRLSATVTTEVEFKALSGAEIDWYLQTGEPFDKAGAYAIQGIGTFLVRRINGSYTNVVGLPVCEVVELLIREGVVKY